MLLGGVPVPLLENVFSRVEEPLGKRAPCLGREGFIFIAEVPSALPTANADPLELLQPATASGRVLCIRLPKSNTRT